MNRIEFNRPKFWVSSDYIKSFRQGQQSMARVPVGTASTSTQSNPPGRPSSSAQDVDPACPERSRGEGVRDPKGPATHPRAFAATSSGEPASAPQPSSSTALPAPVRCAFTTTDGRRCRMFQTANHPEFCDYHAQQELKALDRAPVLPLAAKLLGPLQDFRSAAAINAVMGNAFVQLADGRLDPRRAAILTYMAQLIMQTLKKISWEGLNDDPSPNLEKALKASLKASVSKSEAEKLIRNIYSAALDEAGPAALNLP